MIDHAYNDNVTIKVSTMPSGLVEVPRINEKYEIRTKDEMIRGRDLKSMEIVTNRNKDPIMNLNAAFFTHDKKAPLPSDPYEEIFKKQKEVQDQNLAPKSGYLKGLVYRTDIDHPLSFHNQTLNNYVPTYKVAFPPLVTAKDLASVEMVKNGFYSKENFSLKGAYKENINSNLVMPLDERFAFQTRDSF